MFKKLLNRFVKKGYNENFKNIKQIENKSVFHKNF